MKDAHLWLENKEDYLKLSQRAVEYCKNQDQSDTGWRIETIYHLLIANPNDGEELLRKTVWGWLDAPNFAYDKVDAMVITAREHADAGRFTDKCLSWTIFWEAQINFKYFRFEIANELYKKALDSFKKIGIKLGSALCLEYLGYIHSIHSEYDKAIQHYEEAIHIYKLIDNQYGIANCKKAIGDILLSKDKHGESFEMYQDCLTIYTKINDQGGKARCIKGCGDIYRIRFQYDKAYESYVKAQHIYKEIGDRLGEANCLKGFGDIYSMSSKYNNALDYYNSYSSGYPFRVDEFSG